jgi:hypothetical protein
MREILMKQRAAALIIIAAAFAVNAQAQQPAPGTVPNSAKSRRAFDQFDLPSGIRISSTPSPDTSAAKTNPPAIAEPLDETTYSEIRKLIEYSSDIERSYRAAFDQKADPPDYYAPDNVLQRKLTATYKIIEIYRVGLLGKNPLREPQNLSLLKQNQTIIDDLLSTIPSIWTDTVPAGSRVEFIAQRYGVAPVNAAGGSGKFIKKRELIWTMLALLNKNFAILKGQIALDQ